MHRALLWSVLVAIGVPALAGAQEPPPPSTSPSSADPATATAPVQRFDAEPVAPSLPTPGSPVAGQTALTMDEVAVSSGSARVTLNLFGDTGLQVLSTSARRPAFVLGPLDLLLVGQYGGLVALSEIGLGTQPSGEAGIDVERFSVGWRTDRFSVDAGRTHTELGYWNNAFHHGRWLQLTVERPRAVAFEDEGGVLPVHSVGLTGKWRPLVGDRQVEVIGAVTNGRGKIVDDIQVADDTNGQKALLLQINERGFLSRDLRLGLSGMYDRIARAPMVRLALPDRAITEVIGNAYLAYRGPSLTVIAEAFDIYHRAAGVDWNTVDAFVLVGYRLGALIPYVMGEGRRGQLSADPFFVPDPSMPPALLGRFAEVTTGLRWELNAWSAVKLEYRGTFRAEPGDANVHRGIIDWAFGL